MHVDITSISPSHAMQLGPDQYFSLKEKRKICSLQKIV